MKRSVILIMLALGLLASLFSSALGITGHIDKSISSDSISVKSERLQKLLFAGNCYDINWAAWPSLNGVNSITGTVVNATGKTISINVNANYAFGTTPSTYNFAKFSNYPSTIPNATVPKTEWSAGQGGVTTMCFSEKVTNPVLLLASLGSSLPLTARLKFSLPYVVLYDGGGMAYENSTTIAGTEGYAIIMFPGEFTCVTINSNTPENYTNLTWGIRPQPFNINITNEASTCGSVTLTASGGVSYHWDGGDTPNQATNTFHQSGTYVVTVTNAEGCTTSASKEVVVSDNVPPKITSFAVPGQNGPAAINQANHTITLSVPPKTNRAHLTPTITTDVGTINPASGVEQDFTGAVTYHLNNSCGATDYKVTITNAFLSDIHVCQASTFNVLIPGDDIQGATYKWQILKNNTWQDIGTDANVNNYLASFTGAPTNTTIIESYRRKVTTGNITVYDSYADLYFEPSLSNNQITSDHQSVCASISNLINLTGTLPDGGSGNITYQWRSSTDNASWDNINDATQKDYQFTFNGTSTIYYSRVARSNSCDNVSNVVKIDYVSPVTAAIAGSAQTLCGASQVELAANIPKATEVGSWSVVSPADYDPFNISDSHNPKAVIGNLPPDTDITLKWSITNNCSELSESTVVIRSNGVPAVSAGSDIAIDIGESTTLNGFVYGSNTTYQWSPQTGLSNPYVLNPVASPTETTTYKFTAFTTTGCSTFATVKVYVKNELIIPNTITPNGDGINDEWNIKNILSFKNISVGVYDRGGQQVYYSAGYGKPWNGTMNNKKLPAGVYYYIIRSADNKIKKSGSVTIIY